jgi:hypothetical protein
MRLNYLPNPPFLTNVLLLTIYYYYAKIVKDKAVPIGNTIGPNRRTP